MDIFGAYENAPVFVWNAIHHTLKVEGGYVNDPDDTGGETNSGITKKVAEMFKETWKHYNWDGNIKTMPEEFAADVYTYEYYLKPNFDLIAEICPEVAKELFDSGVNMGYRKPSKWLQEFLNVMNNKQEYWDDIAVDGYIGEQTQTMLAKYVQKRGTQGLKVLYNQLNCLQGAEYHRQALAREKSETFVYGWLTNRTDFI